MTDRTPGARLREAIHAVTPNASEMPYTCAQECFIAWQRGGERIELSASDSALRLCASFRVVIFSRGDYEALKLKLYASLLAAGFSLDAMPGESYNDTTQRRQWPIDVSMTYDLTAALAAVIEEENG